jgi:hypothetical protein
MQNGKGSKPRESAVPKSEYNRNFDKIFKKKKKPKKKAP